MIKDNPQAPRFVLACEVLLIFCLPYLMFSMCVDQRLYANISLYISVHQINRLCPFRKPGFQWRDTKSLKLHYYIHAWMNELINVYELGMHRSDTLDRCRLQTGHFQWIGYRWDETDLNPMLLIYTINKKSACAPARSLQLFPYTSRINLNTYWLI